MEVSGSKSVANCGRSKYKVSMCFDDSFHFHEDVENPIRLCDLIGTSGHFAGVEDVALHYFQSLVRLADFLGGADVGRNKMTVLHREANEMPANAARSAKNEQFHDLVSLEGGSAA